MRWARPHLTFANVVSVIALGIVLGGTAYALTRNAVKARNIAPNAVTNKHTRFFTEGPFKKVTAAPSEAAAPDINLLKVGPFTIYAKCFSEGSDLTTQMYIKTSRPGAIYTSDVTTQSGEPPEGFLNPGDPPASRVLDDGTLGTGNAGVQPAEDVNVVAAQGSTFLEARFLHAAKNGTLPDGNGVYGAGKRCLYAVAASHRG